MFQVFDYLSTKKHSTGSVRSRSQGAEIISAFHPQPRVASSNGQQHAHREAVLEQAADKDSWLMLNLPPHTVQSYTDGPSLPYSLHQPRLTPPPHAGTAAFRASGPAELSDAAHLVSHSYQAAAATDSLYGEHHSPGRRRVPKPSLSELVSRLSERPTCLRKTLSLGDSHSSLACNEGGMYSWGRSVSDSCHSRKAAQISWEKGPKQQSSSTDDVACSTTLADDQQLQRQLASAAVPKVAEVDSRNRSMGQVLPTASNVSASRQTLGMLSTWENIEIGFEHSGLLGAASETGASTLGEQPVSHWSHIVHDQEQPRRLGTFKVIDSEDWVSLDGPQPLPSSIDSSAGQEARGGIKAHFATARGSMKKLTAKSQAMAASAAEAYADSSLADKISVQKQYLVQHATASDAAALADRLTRKSQVVLRRAAASDGAAVASAKASDAATIATEYAATASVALRGFRAKSFAWLERQKSNG